MPGTYLAPGAVAAQECAGPGGWDLVKVEGKSREQACFGVCVWGCELWEVRFAAERVQVCVRIRWGCWARSCQMCMTGTWLLVQWQLSTCSSSTAWGWRRRRGCSGREEQQQQLESMWVHEDGGCWQQDYKAACMLPKHCLQGAHPKAAAAEVSGSANSACARPTCNTLC